MKITPHHHHSGATLVVACILAFIVLMVGLSLIVILLRFCKHLPGVGGGSGNSTNQPPDITSTFTIIGADQVPAAQAQAMIAQAQAMAPCGFQISGLALPADIPPGLVVTIERTTNLVDWEAIGSTVWDGTQAAPICDTNAPASCALYRARAD